MNEPLRRFGVGRRVLVGQLRRIGTVKSVSDRSDPKCMGEYRHEVLVDGETEILPVMGCNLEAAPEADEDLRESRPTVLLNIRDSSVANLNLGTQVGTISIALESISQRHSQADREFVGAIKQLTEAVVAQTAMADADKREILDVVSTLAEEGAKKPEQRSMGRLKSALAWLPPALAAASSLTNLWHTIGPVIRGYLHL